MSNQENIKVHTPESLAQDENVAEAPLVPAATIGNVAAASRQFAEVKGMIELARMFPRNENDAFKHMRRVCKRPRFADDSLYAFPRGDKIVSGPSIRLIEALVRGFRNIDYGFRIMEMRDDRSLVEAFAWDTENNIKARREFWVMHIRETKSGNYPITSPRDIYELCANMAQRRVRACVMEMLPVDLIEEAIQIVKKTMAGGDGMPFEDRVRNMVLAFGELGVSEKMIEGFLGHSLKAIVVEEMPRLRQVCNSIRDGLAKRDDFFDVPPPSADIPEPKDKATKTEVVPGDSMSDEDRAVLEKAKKKMEDKRAEETKQEPESVNEGADDTVSEPADGNGKPMSQEEMEEIQAREKAEYEAEQAVRNGTTESKEPTELDLGDKSKATGGRKPRQARATKKKSYEDN